MSYGPGPTSAGGYDPSMQHGYPPPAGGVPPSFPPNAPVGGYPQDPYGGGPSGYPPQGMPPQGMPQPGGPMGYGPYPGGPGHPQPQNNGLKIALISLVALLVLGGAGTAAYFLLQKDDKPAAVAPAETTAAPSALPEDNNTTEAQDGKQQGRRDEERDERFREESDGPTPLAPNFDTDKESPDTGDSGGGLPTSRIFTSIPRDAAPSSVGDFEVTYTDGSSGYQHKSDWTFYLVKWAKATDDDIAQEMQFHEKVVNDGNIKCGEFVLISCYAPHPQHAGVWIEVSGLGDSTEDTSAFTKMLLEKMK
ncbi:hypothetical protein EII12_07765 [Buchananella hordeovulneris]|uniref:hypothetical protein n=1 Tax=Buchananella hordeovulneris TaxID=52770 RepID=UPI000F5DBD1E|nr:hypothetical protein [Buchananella hordeovulneris]RRD51658.1 hypothetical protein EII12_07765 [Buchananella hordeovulneris]